MCQLKHFNREHNWQLDGIYGDSWKCFLLSRQKSLYHTFVTFWSLISKLSVFLSRRNQNVTKGWLRNIHKDLIEINLPNETFVRTFAKLDLNCYAIQNNKSLIHTFVNIPALLFKNTLRFLIRAGILTKVWIGDIPLISIKNSQKKIE